MMNIDETARERDINRKQRRMELLCEMLQEAYHTITERKIQDFYNHMLNILPRAMAATAM